MQGVIIGVDPHRLSATIEVVDQHEKLLGSGRFGTDQAGCTAMGTYVKGWPERVWAVEGSNGAGRPLAQRLLEAGEQVVDVPAKLAARVRLFDTGHNRKTPSMRTSSRRFGCSPIDATSSPTCGCRPSTACNGCFPS
jgi:transposase